MRLTLALAAAAAALTPVAAQAQVAQSPQDIIGSILGTLFGGRLGAGAGSTLDAQWSAGQTPLTSQQYQFDTRVDSEVRRGALNAATGTRLKADYAGLVQLERSYAVDGRFTAQERADLANRYNTLTQVLAGGGYADGGTLGTAQVAAGRAEFDQRVDLAVSQRRITRAQATRLKSDYAALIQVESGYLRDGVLTAAERNDLDVRLDALDARVGDVSLGNPTVQTPRARLEAISRALPTARLGRPQQAQLQVELEDLMRLEAAYARLNPTADERAYLERRLVDLETRVRLR